MTMKREITHTSLFVNRLSRVQFFTSYTDVAFEDILEIILTFVCYILFLLLIWSGHDSCELEKWP